MLFSSWSGYLLTEAPCGTEDGIVKGSVLVDGLGFPGQTFGGNLLVLLAGVLESRRKEGQRPRRSSGRGPWARVIRDRRPSLFSELGQARQCIVHRASTSPGKA